MLVLVPTSTVHDLQYRSSWIQQKTIQEDCSPAGLSLHLSLSCPYPLASAMLKACKSTQPRVLYRVQMG